MFEKKIFDFTYTQFHARDKWGEENDVEILNRHHEWAKLSPKIRLKYLNMTEIAESDLNRSYCVDIQNGRMKVYRSTNETVNQLKNRIKNLSKEIRDRPLGFNTQSGIGIYWFADKESVMLSRWVEQKGLNKYLITASIELNKLANALDTYDLANKFNTWLDDNEEKIRKKNLVDKSSAFYLTDFAWQIFLMKFTSFVGYIENVNNILFWGNNNDIKIDKIYTPLII